MRPNTLAVRDQLLAALNGRALSTRDLSVLAPPVVEIRHGCHPAWHAPGATTSQTLRDVCKGTHHVHTRRRFEHEVYRQLRALERAGAIAKHPGANGRTVKWARVRPAPDMSALEAAWKLAAREPSQRGASGEVDS